MIAIEQYVNDFHGLLLHVFRRTRVLDNEMRHIALVFERHLRLNAFLRFAERQTVAIHESSDLYVLLGRHADDLMNVINETRVDLEEQRQFKNDEILSQKEILENLFVDSTMNDGMGELVELAAFLDVIEYDLAQFVTIQRLIFIQYFIAEKLSYLFPYWLARLNN